MTAWVATSALQPSPSFSQHLEPPAKLEAPSAITNPSRLVGYCRSGNCSQRPLVSLGEVLSYPVPDSHKGQEATNAKMSMGKHLSHLHEWLSLLLLDVPSAQSDRRRGRYAELLQGDCQTADFVAKNIHRLGQGSNRTGPMVLADNGMSFCFEDRELHSYTKWKCAKPRKPNNNTKIFFPAPLTRLLCDARPDYVVRLRRLAQASGASSHGSKYVWNGRAKTALTPGSLSHRLQARLQRGDDPTLRLFKPTLAFDLETRLQTFVRALEGCTGVKEHASLLQEHLRGRPQSDRSL
jgi:hypothetical protein